MCCSDKTAGKAHDGRITGRLGANTFQVNVPGVGTVSAQDRTGRAQTGGVGTVVKAGDGWRIV